MTRFVGFVQPIVGHSEEPGFFGRIEGEPGLFAQKKTFIVHRVLSSAKNIFGGVVLSPLHPYRL